MGNDRKFRAIVSSDWHADAVMLGVERYPEIETAVLEVVRYTIGTDDGNTVFVFGGDLANPDNPRTLRAIRLATRVAYLLSTHDIPSIWITGNHDVMEDGLNSHTLLPLVMGNSNVIVADSPGVYCPLAGLKVMCLPYCPRSHPYSPETYIRETSNGVSPQLIVSHLMLDGIAVGSETKDFPRGRDVFLPTHMIAQKFPGSVMINGHYHEGQQYRGVTMPGSLARLTVGEAANTPRFLEIAL